MLLLQSRFLLLLCVLAFGSSLAGRSAQAVETEWKPEQLEFFEREVRPLLIEHCYECHSVDAKRVEASLLLDSRKAHLTGGDSGPSILPGDADGSLLVEAVRYESYEMPPKGKLSDEDVEIVVRWVEMGAPWPEEPEPSAQGVAEAFDLEKRRSEFWVWQPVEDPSKPEVEDTTWPRTEIDHHILARLESAGLKPAGDADQTAILRRLYLDIIGLPPSPGEVAAFVEDASDDSPGNAVARVVDELLESPHFGERWGRHWLDLVRYAESRGHEFDNDTPNAYQYRDYVIRALNADLPYDQFVREHIAGDLLERPRMHPEEGFNESVLGTGFWFLGEWVHSPVDVRKDESDRFDNMIDVMSKTFLGVTVACARCHDHKFDAISTADYYSLSGFLQSSDYRQVRFESIEQNRLVAEQLAKLDATYQRQLIELLNANGVMPPGQESFLRGDAIVVDYASLQPKDFMQDGFIFGKSPRGVGLPYLVKANDTDSDSETSEAEGSADDPGTELQVRFATHGAAVNDAFWTGFESVTKGVVQNRSSVAKLPKSGRTLRSPTFELKHGLVRCKVDGVGHIVACVDSHRMIAGPLHNETIVAVKKNQSWVSLKLERYVGHRLHLEFVPATGQQLSVRLVTQGLEAEGQANFDKRLTEIDRAWETYANEAEAILNRVFVDSATARGEEATGERSEEGKELSGNPEAAPGLQVEAERFASVINAWRKDRAELAKQVVLRSHVAPAMMDGTSEDDRILIRGNSSKPGDIEPRHFLTAIAGDTRIPVVKGSGRLALAAHINDSSNPLTSRVLVNRIWHHLMGRGIVPTVDDFGVLGQRPSHPELLDHLATRFLADGRSIKSMIRYIALSRSYQMSSQVDPAAEEADPKNVMWHHCPPRRLQGEVIRDSLLALSGRLDSTQFGPPVPVHLTGFMDGRGRPGKSGPLDGEGRRSIYTAVRRNFLPPFMLTFDTPVPFSSMGRRNVSNVPAQALILLNDPLVVELAGDWGRRALECIPGKDVVSTGERIDWLYISAFARKPTEQEREVATAYVESQAGSQDDDSAKRSAAWTNLAHALVNTKEFIYLR